MDDLELLVDLHKDGDRQGPGGEAETELAIRLAGLDPSEPLTIADLGCGTGASTLVLARELAAHVTAVDLQPELLRVLRSRARDLGLADRVRTLECSIDALPFEDGELDVIWSEGAVYNIGFEAGVRAWRRFLKPGGVLVVSEVTWLTSDRPHEIETYWRRAYPEIDTASAKISVLETAGYSPGAYFVLPEHCWLDHYYRPAQGRFDDFLARHGHSERARALVEAEREEIALYERYKELYGYGVYVARRTR